MSTIRRALPALTLLPLLAGASLARPFAQEGPTPTPPDAPGWDRFVDEAEASHGALGARAAAFLAEHRPERDAELGFEALDENLRLALEARERFPWAKGVPEELFLNDVVPYAVLDETRESWRPEILPLVEPLVKDCETLVEAAQAINQRFFDVIEVHYNTGRKRPNASPSESIGQGRATCTGLTILLVDACRAVGIPARAAGVMRWHDDRGNHTWAEVWDGERWRFTGADEYDPKGLDRGWFVADAARARAGDVAHAVWASSWRTTGSHFPLVWSRRDRSVNAVDVTERYTGDRESRDAALETLGDGGAALSEEAAQRVVMERWDALRPELAASFEDEVKAEAFQHADQVLRVKERTFGKAPDGGHSLWISMHGGGGAPTRVNDQQWNNQIRLYEPEEGIYVAPRAPTDAWNLWHQGHIDPLFDRLITSYVTRRGVNPNRVYLMGYSAGGDGVYQLAPRIADRFAAAAMMAGHPNDANPAGLRNLPFALFMGGDDGAYNRNGVAAEWKERLAALRASDEEGYEHRVTIYPGKGHWMDGEDKEALPWMAARTREPWPNRVVWIQDDVVHDRFYWLGVPRGSAAKGQRVEARVRGQRIEVVTPGEGPEPADEITLHLHDRLIDLDRPIEVRWNGRAVFEGSVERTRATIEAELAALPDPTRCATALLTVERPVADVQEGGR